MSVNLIGNYELCAKCTGTCILRQMICGHFICLACRFQLYDTTWQCNVCQQLFDPFTRNDLLDRYLFPSSIETTLSTAEMTSVPSVLYDDGDCAICLGPHQNKSSPKCGHVFCYDCLKTLTDHQTNQCRQSQCPTCRQPFHFKSIAKL